MLAVLFLCLLKCNTEMHVLTQGGARCAEMDAAPHIFMRRADPRTHTHLHFRPLLMTPHAAEWSR